jgi:hypothetical protein
MQALRRGISGNGNRSGNVDLVQASQAYTNRAAASPTHSLTAVPAGEGASLAAPPAFAYTAEEAAREEQAEPYAVDEIVASVRRDTARSILASFAAQLSGFDRS